MHRHTEDHPTRNEDEYFARENALLIREIRSLLDDQRRELDRREHFMKCPKCGGDLKERDFEDVKVDVCPDCHGIWLDQGEIGLIRHIHESRGPFSRLMSDILEIFHHPKQGEPSSQSTSSPG
ncbi:MAG TPA: zf-TFIIB domain-containing protein [Gemmatimonadaceae bacterium]|nr:zf-TFIIB domain-containing protein [Gemmatimonadaceae bacterium]